MVCIHRDKKIEEPNQALGVTRHKAKLAKRFLFYFIIVIKCSLSPRKSKQQNEGQPYGVTRNEETLTKSHNADNFTDTNKTKCTSKCHPKFNM